MRISDWSSDVCSSDLAPSPFGVVRPKASLSRCESCRWHGCALGFMAATFQRKQFPLRYAHSSRDKFFWLPGAPLRRSEEHTSELQSLMRISYAVFCLKKQKEEKYENTATNHNITQY